MSLEHVVGPSPRPRPSVADTEASRAVAGDDEIRSMSKAELIARIQQLRRERDAIVLAHNYQIPEIQDLADFVGDSLQLSQVAARNDAPLIVFCGVHFMAETAAILCPDQRVLIPDPEAGCSLAATVTADEVRSWRADDPDTVVVAYVNTDRREGRSRLLLHVRQRRGDRPVHPRRAGDPVPARHVPRVVRRANGGAQVAFVAG
jgi:hypothetical protein